MFSSPLYASLFIGTWIALAATLGIWGMDEWLTWQDKLRSKMRTKR
jgi:hypothetical protein